MSTIIPRAGNITVILSAELDWQNTRQNEDAMQALRERLARQFEKGNLYSVQDCIGAYKGTPEDSIAITGPIANALSIGHCEADKFGQESILAVDHYGHGRLHYTDGDQESIGHYSPLHGAADAWTRVLATGETFTFI